MAGAGLGALQRGRVHALASLWRPSGVPLASRSPVGFKRGTWCTAKGSDVRPGVPLASLWRPSGVPLASLVSAALPVAFAWQARDLVHCKGVGCTPWRPSSVPLASLGLRRSAGGFCAAGVGLGALQRGRMYALASLWRPSGVPLASLWRPSGVPWSPPLCRWLLVITTSSQHHIPKHHLTHHNFTSHATRSVYLCLHTFT